MGKTMKLIKFFLCVFFFSFSSLLWADQKNGHVDIEAALKAWMPKKPGCYEKEKDTPLSYAACMTEYLPKLLAAQRRLVATIEINKLKTARTDCRDMPSRDKEHIKADEKAAMDENKTLRNEQAAWEKYNDAYLTWVMAHGRGSSRFSDYAEQLEVTNEQRLKILLQRYFPLAATCTSSV